MAVTPPQDGTVLIGSLSTHYRDWGGRGRATILLHGLASHCGIWDQVAPLLTAHLRVVALDLRGHGLSAKPNSGYDFDTMAADVRAYWEVMGLNRPVLVGHSWGGNVALHCAASFPDGVSGVVMVDGGFIEPSALPDMTWERAEKEMAPPSFDGVIMETLIERIRQGDLGPIWKPEIERIVASNFDVLPSGEARPKLSRDNHMKIVRALWEHKPSNLIAQLRCPTLIIAAGKEPRRTNSFYQAKRRMVTQIEALLSKGRVIWLDDAIHDIPLQQPKTLARLIVDFAATPSQEADI